MHSFKYAKAHTLETALKAFEEGEDPIYLAGGMTLIPTLKQRLAAPSGVIDLGGLTALDFIQEKDGAIEIGALTTHQKVAFSRAVKNLLPALALLAGQIGDPGVRNRGTLGGSIANNDPAADYPAALLALGATIKTTRKDISADSFFIDLFETALEEGEIITSVSFPIPKKAAYAKFPNPVSRYALVGVFVADFGTKVRVGVTGAGPCVFRWKDLEKALEESFSPQALEDILLDANNFNEDIHASAAYRVHLLKVMAKKAILGCQEP